MDPLNLAMWLPEARSCNIFSSTCALVVGLSYKKGIGV
jgi:hypothetical protein